MAAVDNFDTMTYSCMYHMLVLLSTAGKLLTVSHRVDNALHLSLVGQDLAFSVPVIQLYVAYALRVLLYADYCTSCSC